MRLNPIFKDNMVLQRSKPVRISGTAGIVPPSGNVTARIKDGETVLSSGLTSSFNEDGSFTLILPELAAGGPYTLEVTCGTEQISLKNVFAGEVWIAGGQSNMEYPLGRSEGAETAVSSCPETNIHFYHVPVTDDPSDGTDTKWDVIDRDTCYDMSGVAFYFARNLGKSLADVHIGIIGCYLGGTSVSSWQSAEALNSTPEGRRYIDDHKTECGKWKNEQEYTAAELLYKEQAGQYEDKVRRVLADDPYKTYADTDKITGAGPWPPPVTPVSIRRPGALYEGMVAPLAPFSVRGVIFYQGEEDTGSRSGDYAALFGSLIRDWRSAFGDPDMPFLFCGLPEFPLSANGGREDPGWQELRDQQRLVADTISNSYMADLTGCGEIDNVHPSDKKTPGGRLADLALRFVY